MPAQYIQPDTTDHQYRTDAAVTRQRYRYAAQVAGTGDWILLPPGLGDVIVSVDPGPGTARVEYTLASVADVESGMATARNWQEGDVSGYTDSILKCAFTAVRCVSTDAAEFVVTI